MYKRKLFIEMYFSFLTFLSSFMYHSLDALDIEGFLITEYEWHVIDNIGAISCITMLLYFFIL
jgi:hypothetical protein